MILYAALMILTSILLWAVGALICRGRTGLIHDYHQMNVKEEDLPAYGRAMAAGLFVLAGSFDLSGIFALFGENRFFSSASLAVLFVGIAVSVVLLVRAQKKYNGGMF